MPYELLVVSSLKAAVKYILVRYIKSAQDPLHMDSREHYRMFLRLMPTLHSKGFLRKPSRVSNCDTIILTRYLQKTERLRTSLSGCSRTKSYRRRIDEMMICNSMEARLRPTHALECDCETTAAIIQPKTHLGPKENGLKVFWIACCSCSNHLSGLKSSASSPQTVLSRWIV